MYEEAFGDLVANCGCPDTWLERYVVCDDNGELVCRFAGGTHLMFLLADHLSRTERGHGLLRSEVYQDYRKYPLVI